MRLVQIRKTLLAASRRKGSSLHVRRAANEADVRELVRAGLLEATSSDGAPGSLMTIGAVTEAGYQFLRTFRAGYRFCEGC